MSVLFRAIALLFTALLPLGAVAQGPADPVRVASGVEYAFIGRWDVDRLDTILTTDTPAFAGIDVTYTRAQNAVNLYRVTSVSYTHLTLPTILLV